MIHPRLDEIERLTGSRATTLRGHIENCPNAIAQTVASEYAITECGRLFHWRYDRLQELLPYMDAYHDERFVISVRHTRWKIARRTLLDSAFPDRPLTVDDTGVDWLAYDPDKPIPNTGYDALSEVQIPDNAKVKKRTPDQHEVDRAWRAWYGD